MSTRTLHLDSRGGPGADLLISGAHVFDPREQLDGIADVLVRDGEIAEIGTDLEPPEGAETLDASGLHAFPAFVDPHVHLRTPGREDEEGVAAEEVPERDEAGEQPPARPHARMVVYHEWSSG